MESLIVKYLKKLSYIRNKKRVNIIFLLVALLGCDKQTKKFVSCASPISSALNIDEYVKYAFTDTTVKVVSATTISIDEEKSMVLFNSDEGEHKYNIYYGCTDKIDKKRDKETLSREEAFILKGRVYEGSDKQLKKRKISSKTRTDAPPPIDGAEIEVKKILCKGDFITVGAGTFFASECVELEENNNSTIKKRTFFSTSGERIGITLVKPFSGFIKSIVEFKDGHKITAELIEWNHL